MSSESSDEEVTLPNGNPLASDLRSYLPNKFPEREEEMKKLKRLFSPAARGSIPNNGEVTGPAGQGKTAAVMMWTETLRQRHAVTPLYVDCTGCRKVAEVWERLVERARIEHHRHLPVGDITGSRDILIDQFEDATRQIGGVIVVVLDGLDLEESVNDLLYTLSRFNVEGVKLGSVVISKNPEFRKDVERDTMGSWSPRSIHFSRYDETALVSILQWRVELLDRDYKNITTQSIESVAGRVVEEFGGSAEAAIDILRYARFDGRNAEEIGEEHIENAVNRYRNMHMMSEIGEAEIPSKAVVAAVTRAASTAHGQAPTVGEAYSVYCELTEDAGIQQFSEAKFREELDAWIKIGIFSETADGVIPQLDSDLIHEAVFWQDKYKFGEPLSS